MDCVERVARTWTYDESRVGSSAICTEIDASARRERERDRERESRFKAEIERSAGYIGFRG